jgi:hypothetical protein
MPKATPKDTEVVDVEKPKRAPRKRVARPKKVEAVTEEVVSDVTETVVAPAPKPRARRKAPTKVMKEEVEVVVPEAESPKLRLKTVGRRSIYVYAGVITASFVAAAVIGYSDKGQINITEAVEMHNAALVAGNVASAEAAARNGQVPDTSMVIPVQNNPSNLPDGGLIASGALPPPPVVEEVVSTSTATSSEAVASTTEAVASTTEASVEEVEVPTE